MKKTKLLFVLSAMMLGCMVVNNGVVESNKVVVAATPNDVTKCDGNLGEKVPETNAVTIDYTGGKTPVYGIQAYAGLKGPAWVTGDVAPILEEGKGSHNIGSNHGDKRNGFELSFSVNSTVAGDAYLGLYGLFNTHSNATYSVNGGEAISTNLMVHEWLDYVPTLLPVTLVEGVNNVTVTMGEDYTAWLYSFFVTNSTNWADGVTHNDSWFRDGDAKQTTPATIKYDGNATKVYGIQSYAGVNGPAWVVGSVANVLEDGSSSHPLGSNVGDGRSGLEVSFSINSLLETDVNLNVFAEYYTDVGPTATNATLNVNGTTSNINFFSLHNNVWSNGGDATKIPVTLKQGDNLIKIKMQDNYGIWFKSWSVTPLNSLPKYNQINIGSWSNKQGYMSAGGDHFGINACDNAADYGKSGSVDYVFTCEETGDYYLKLTAMAGLNVANRIELTINNNVFNYKGNNYISLDCSGGWSKDSLNIYKIPLNSGTNVITFANSLVNVNSNKNQEVPEGTEGSIKISNFWVHQVQIFKAPAFEQTTNAAALAFDYVDLDGTYSDFSNARMLFKSEFDIDSSVISCGVVVTSKEFNAEDYIKALPSGKGYMTFANTSKKSSYVVSIDNVPLNVSYANTEISAIAYIQTADGYFYNQVKTVSLLSFYNVYSASDDALVVALAEALYAQIVATA